ncbi:MAG: CPBP family intramembrane metalloprotease [Candidatus Heimdallarchaeum aukensis]|uniref:CPBP family intramembrane metalloprotease n=1 Tax=Candidatus Heimdallarchaeum aukensis TaxID=2876573 RepID=A0A9Y1BLD8_9ARCH|nr:MAG: CPBP family intramembrane metalloprotease [Candidatus Heimdallarchaeum aukensis]
MHNKEKRKQLFLFIFALIISITLAIVLTLVEKQVSVPKMIIFGFSSFLNIITICIFTFPYINKIVIEYLKGRKIYYLFLLVVIINPLLNWIFIDSLNGFIVAFLSYLAWIALPVIAFMQAYVIDKIKFKSLLLVAGILILAYGFDSRLMYSVLSGFDEGKYSFSSLWVSAIILTIYSIQLEKAEIRLRWTLNLKKLILSLGSLVVLFAVIVPLGLYTEFLVWSPDWPGFALFILAFIGIWFTIALPEELIARSIIQYQLSEKTVPKSSKYYKYHKWIILVVASFIFGLSHHNNTSAEFAWIYIGFATFAGILYGICWRYGNLATAMLTHTLVDWIWQLLFR